MPARFALSTLSAVSRPIVRILHLSTNQTTIMLRIVTNGCERVKPKEARYLGLFCRFLNVSERGRTSRWRREWDSNPRYGFPYTRFPSVRLKPLGHPSGTVAARAI